MPNVDGTELYRDAIKKIDRYEQSLRAIAGMWPEPGMCAELVPKWVGPNDGRMRADALWYAINAARKALGLPTHPKPAHWEKGDES
jgi:hypothetical protein